MRRRECPQVKPAIYELQWVPFVRLGIVLSSGFHQKAGDIDCCGHQNSDTFLVHERPVEPTADIATPSSRSTRPEFPPGVAAGLVVWQIT